MKKLLLAMTCYGSYIDTFFQYCWPSLQTAGNLPLLRKHRDVEILIHTDHYGMDKFDFVGNATLDNMQGDKYDILGRHQHEDLKMAKEVGADYSCLMPDNVYSENCFAGILKMIERGCTGIVRLLPSTTMEDISPVLDGYRRDSILAVPASDLATLGLVHLHPGVRCWRASDAGYPHTHVVVWDAKDTLHQHSPHCTPVYIANEAICVDDSILPIDSNIDRVIMGIISCPRAEDEAVIIEVTPRDNRKPNDKHVDLQEFCRIFKHNTRGSLRQLQVFYSGTIDPINRTMLPGSYWKLPGIIAQKNSIVHAIDNFHGE